MAIFWAALLKPFVVLFFMVCGILLTSFMEKKMPDSKLKRFLLTPIGKRHSRAK